MTVQAVDSVARARGQAMRAGGFWRDRSVDSYFAEAIATTPDRIAIAAYRTDRPAPEHLTYRALGDRVAVAAGSLRALGIGRQDVVAVQLPNWLEFVVIALACGRVGAVVNPLMPIFRERELSFMLGFAEAKMLVVPKTFRGFDHAAMGAALQRELPALKHVVVVDDDGNGENSFDDMLLKRTNRQRVEPARDAASAPIAPDDLAVLMFTSGTTGSPKGVMHTNNTLVACTFALGDRFGLGTDVVANACSPLGHMMGFTAAWLTGLRLGGTVVLQDFWEPTRGVEIMTAEGVTYMPAATPFLADICDAVARGFPRPPSLTSFLCGGAPIPPVLIERAKREIDLDVCSLWGMTECLAGTLTEPSRASEKSSTTDGRAMDGVEVRVVDLDGAPVATGESGRLQVRGSQNFIGYFKRPDISFGDAEGWFDSGDLAYMDAEGYIRISGRTKDLLVRGGENVPVFEIESLLYKHPAVQDVAIVGFPDERLGERACAFIVVKPNATIDVVSVQAYMAENKVAKQYWPERVEVTTQLPRTPSGKVQKFKLRETLHERKESR